MPMTSKRTSLKGHRPIKQQCLLLLQHTPPHTRSMHPHPPPLFQRQIKSLSNPHKHQPTQPPLIRTPLKHNSIPHPIITIVPKNFLTPQTLLKQPIHRLTLLLRLREFPARSLGQDVFPQGLDVVAGRLGEGFGVRGCDFVVVVAVIG